MYVKPCGFISALVYSPRQIDEENRRDTIRKAAAVGISMLGLLALGMSTNPTFLSSLTTFTLACIIGYNVIWGVTPALHSPLMSVTNAISGMRSFKHLSTEIFGYMYYMYFQTQYRWYCSMFWHTHIYTRYTTIICMYTTYVFDDAAGDRIF
jgi:hypothetical protein